MKLRTGLEHEFTLLSTIVDNADRYYRKWTIIIEVNWELDIPRE